MYANLNLEGRIVSDPEFRTGKGNREYCTFGISGHCMSMKREDLKSRQMPSRELFTADVTAAIAT